MNDQINPQHYKNLEGIDCIEISRHLNFDLGNSLKYAWRIGHKDPELQELQKIRWYLNDCAKYNIPKFSSGAGKKQVIKLIDEHFHHDKKNIIRKSEHNVLMIIIMVIDGSMGIICANQLVQNLIDELK